MPPKVKVSKEDIVNAAMELVRQNGLQAVNARSVAAALECSTQPVFSNFANMEDLHLAVIERAEQLYADYTSHEMQGGQYPPYKAGGMAYIRFAKEEKELFKLLFMCNRADKSIPQKSDSFDQMADFVHQNLGISTEKAQLFHLEMWAFVHGIATMFATDFLDLDWDLVSGMLTDAYQGVLKQYKKEA